MKTKEKKHYIYLRSTKERVPATKEEFDNYYRDINAFRQRQQYHGCCVCPKAKHLDCDMDCVTCPYHRSGNNLSLDYTVADNEGNEKSWVDNLADPAPPVDEVVSNSILLTQILHRVEEIMPQAIQIGQLRQLGYTEEAIANKIGIGRKTYAYRLKKLRAKLETEFPGCF